MDKRIRKNDHCVVGQPRCDFVYSSTRNCFIGYGFEESSIEMELIKRILTEKGVEPIEAGGFVAPGQNAFCAKICSKIITAQFCIILLNNDVKDGEEIPNANVNMEYGLMLGFNKYVIPFQKEEQKLPFNVAGLDTIKYSNVNFEKKATDAIEEALIVTTQDNNLKTDSDQILESYLLAKNAMVSSLKSQGEHEIFDLGIPLGFNLLNDFSGLNYIFFGNFKHLRPEIILWRLKTLGSILNERKGSLEIRVETGIVTEKAADFANSLIENLKIWIVVTSNEDKAIVNDNLQDSPLGYSLSVISITDMETELASLFSN